MLTYIEGVSPEVARSRQEIWDQVSPRVTAPMLGHLKLSFSAEEIIAALKSHHNKAAQAKMGSLLESLSNIGI